MSISRPDSYWIGLLNEHRKLKNELTTVEFKSNLNAPEDIGQYISALSNSATLYNESRSYIWWGVSDEEGHAITGTTFDPWSKKAAGNQALIPWLHAQLDPKTHFDFHKISVDGADVVLMEISRAVHHSVKFRGVAYIRKDSHKKALKSAPELEAALWKALDSTPFEDQLAVENIPSEKVLELLDYDSYYRMAQLPLPDGHQRILEGLAAEEIILPCEAGGWNITNLGALLFARSLREFRHLRSKAVRVIEYAGKNKLETKREQEGGKGYVVGFEGLMDYINTLIPKNEILGQALRKEVAMYPERALRELVANSLIHQDLSQSGGPIIELFSNRIVISNPGKPLVNTNRFLDGRKSRNEAIARMMRLLRICEERGSGIDKVVFDTELYQLPAPSFSVEETPLPTTEAKLFAHKSFDQMDKDDRLRACYLHVSLKHVNGEYANNESVRERFKFEKKNSSMASRILKDTIEAGLIRLYDPAAGTKSRRYVPFWG